MTGFDDLLEKLGQGKTAGGGSVEAKVGLAAVAGAIDDNTLEVDDIDLGKIKVVAVVVHALAPFGLDHSKIGEKGNLGRIERGDVGKSVNNVARGLRAGQVVGHEAGGVEILANLAGLVQDEGLEVVLLVVEDAGGGDAVVEIAGEEEWDEGDDDKPKGQLGKQPPVALERRRARRRARHPF